MDKDLYLPIIIVIGLITLFVFPEPQTNFILYLLTALFFIILAVLTIIFKKHL